jgi:hypothetical protein
MPCRAFLKRSQCRNFSLEKISLLFRTMQRACVTLPSSDFRPSAFAGGDLADSPSEVERSRSLT